MSSWGDARRPALQVTTQEAERFVEYNCISSARLSETPGRETKCKGGDVHCSSPCSIDGSKHFTVTLEEEIALGLIASLNKNDAKDVWIVKHRSQSQRYNFADMIFELLLGLLGDPLNDGTRLFIAARLCDLTVHGVLLRRLQRPKQI